LDHGKGPKRDSGKSVQNKEDDEESKGKARETRDRYKDHKDSVEPLAIYRGVATLTFPSMVMIGSPQCKRILHVRFQFGSRLRYAGIPY
jgi:hypothetical protein